MQWRFTVCQSWLHTKKQARAYAAARPQLTVENKGPSRRASLCEPPGVAATVRVGPAPTLGALFDAAALVALDLDCRPFARRKLFNILRLSCRLLAFWCGGNFSFFINPCINNTPTQICESTTFYTIIFSNNETLNFNILAV